MEILLAEDDPVFQVMLQRTLTRWGYDVILVTNGEKAWQQLRSPAGPRLAILDWVMPGADGLEVCRRVRAGNLPHYVYIILLTGKTQANDLVAGLEAGADDYLTKPVEGAKLRLRLRAASRVLLSEERHRIMAETASDGIIRIEHEDRIQYANPAAAAIFGRPVDELVGAALSGLVRDFELDLAKVAATRSGDIRSWPTIAMTGRHQSGREMILEVSFSESNVSDGNRVLTAVIRDATERRILESQRSQAQKLESIGQLASGVAHEINTPIQYIGDNLRFVEESYGCQQKLVEAYRQALEAARSGADPEAAAREVENTAKEIDLDFLQRETPGAIEAALEGVERVAEIVRAMKEFSHPGTVEMTATDLNRIIETTALVSRNRWKYVAELKTSLDPSLPFVTCAAGELSQVFLNLIVNAADAIGDALQDQPGRQGTIWIDSSCDGEFAEIRVRDTGTGIPPQVRAKIFDPFFTTKDVGRGTGQGLAIAYNIVAQKHQGTIAFETATGEGTTFIVRLPVAGPFGDGQSALREESFASQP